MDEGICKKVVVKVRGFVKTAGVWCEPRSKVRIVKTAAKKAESNICMHALGLVAPWALNRFVQRAFFSKCAVTI